MSKKFFGRTFISLIILSAAILWLLSKTSPNTFGFFNLSWAIALVTIAAGSQILIKALLLKNAVAVEKTQIVFATVLYIIGFISITFAITVPKNIVWPIIAIIIAGAIFVSIIATGGQKWDHGDNQNINYQNYFKRKNKNDNQIDE